ncbi:MAG: hypothetical protein NTY19_07905, partial [Planctomycetota bacterium]|nr:hypothetical protein [Planctomycetota bacterium]
MDLSGWFQRFLNGVRRDRGRRTQWLYDEAEPQLYVTQLEQRRVLTASLVQQSLANSLMGGSSAASALGSSSLNGQPLDAHASCDTRLVSQDAQATASSVSVAHNQLPPLTTKYAHTAQELRALLSPAASAVAPSDNPFSPPAAAEQQPVASLPALDIGGVAAPHTLVALDASNNLVVTPASSGAEHGVLTIQSDATHQAFVITDASARLTTGIAGATGDGSQQVTIPFASVRGDKLIVEAADAHRTLVLDFSSGPLTKTVEFNGGQAEDGILVLTGGSVKSVDYAFQGKSDGEVTIGTDSGATTVRFSGVQTFVDDLSVENRGFQLTAESETITLSDDARVGDHHSLFQSSLGTSVTFADPGVSLTIRDSHDSTAGDTIDVTGLDSTFSANLAIYAGGTDTITFGGPVDLGSGDLTVTGGRIGVTQTITTHDATIDLSAVHALTISSTGVITDVRGTIRVQAPTLSHDGLISAVGGGQVYLDAGSQGTTLVSGVIDVSAREPGQVGGTIHLLGDRVGLIDNTRIDASGSSGGGTVLIGGDYQGKNRSIRNASRTYVGPDTEIVADAIDAGNGGRVIVWADEVTRFHGTITARGGAMAGNGGFVETSGKGSLVFDGRVDTSAPAGSLGTLLLDPKFIEVKITGGVAYDPTPGTGNNLFATPNATSAQTIDPGSIDAASANIILQANDDVTFTDTLAMSSPGKTLTVQAGRSIIISADISTNNGAITMTANETVLNGVVNAQRNAGAAVITMASGTTIDAGNADITIQISTGPTTNNTSGDITLDDLTTVGDVLVVNNGPTAGSGIVRVSGASLITATTVALDVNGAGGGGNIGSLGNEIGVMTTSLEARSQSAGVFIASSKGVILGGAALGTLTGISTSSGGAIAVTTVVGGITVSEAISGTGGIALTSQNTLAINNAVNAGGGSVALTTTGAGNAITQNGTGVITASDLTLATANANATLNTATNAVTNLGTTTLGTGALNLLDAGGLTVTGVVGATAGVTLNTSGALAINNAVTATGATVALTTTGAGNAITQNGTGVITATTLVLTTAGSNATLNTATNALTNLGATALGTGALNLLDAGGLIVTGVVGATGGVTLNTSGTLAINNTVTATGAMVALTTTGGAGNAITQTGVITATDLTLTTSNANATLNGATNVLTNLGTTTLGAGALNLLDAGGLIVTGVVGATGGVTLNTSGALAINNTVTATGASVALTTTGPGNAITQNASGGITASNLTLTTSNASATLNTATSVVTTIGTVSLGTGALAFKDAVSAGLSVAGASLTANGGVDVTNTTGNLTTTGSLAVTEGSISLTAVAAGKTLTLGGTVTASNNVALTSDGALDTGADLVQATAGTATL